jgi:hypothetical protein
MKYYAQFYRHSYDTTSSKTEIIGSNGVYILDGRNKLLTMIEDARKRISQMKGVHSDIVAFTIHRGERFSKSQLIYDSNPELKII